MITLLHKLPVKNKKANVTEQSRRAVANKYQLQWQKEKARQSQDWKELIRGPAVCFALYLSFIFILLPNILPSIFFGLITMSQT